MPENDSIIRHPAGGGKPGGGIYRQNDNNNLSKNMTAAIGMVCFRAENMPRGGAQSAGDFLVFPEEGAAKLQRSTYGNGVRRSSYGRRSDANAH